MTQYLLQIGTAGADVLVFQFRVSACPMEVFANSYTWDSYQSITAPM